MSQWRSFRNFRIPDLVVNLDLGFLWWAVGDYWIVDLAPDYLHAVVGTSDLSKLWI